MTDPLAFRNPQIVIALLGYVYDADAPVPWDELLETFTPDPDKWKTTENVIYELVAFGALHRIGKPATRNRYGGHTADTRALKPTPLGRAWLDRELLEIPGAPDPLEEADDVALELAEDLELEIHTLEPGTEP